MIRKLRGRRVDQRAPGRTINRLDHRLHIDEGSVYHPSTAATTAMRWLTALKEDDFDTTWRLSDQRLRLVMMDEFRNSHPGAWSALLPGERSAQEMVEGWARFVNWMMSVYRTRLSPLSLAFERTRILGTCEVPGYEVVRFEEVRTEDMNEDVLSGHRQLSFNLLMRFEEGKGWGVTNIEDSFTPDPVGGNP